MDSPATWSAMLAAWQGIEEPAVIAPEGTWSGADLLANAAGAADWLDQHDAPAGEAIGALVTSSAAAFALIIGAATSARPLAPLGPRLTSRELTACIQASALRSLVIEAQFADVAGSVHDATGVSILVLPEPAPSRRRLKLDSAGDDIAFILHTSGTSGIPKPVPYRQDRMARRATVHTGLASLGPGSRFASASPFHHIAGWGNYASALAGGSAIIPVPAFSVEAWKSLAEHRPTNALVVPTMIDTLLDAAALELAGLRFLHYGGSQIHPETLARVLATVPNAGLINIFGQTEGSPITCLTPDDHRRAASGRPDLLASVGRPAPGIELRIEQPDDDGVGQICARGFHLMRADDDGWLRTGDLGRTDGEGYVFLLGRKDDRIVRGGENVHPQEVEHIIQEHPAVGECAVVGVPDVKWGEVVKAYVVSADPDHPPDPEALRAWARSQLAGFKVPVAWALVTELPKNAAGKVLRRVLAERDPVN